jgi:hypothetical protein
MLNGWTMYVEGYSGKETVYNVLRCIHILHVRDDVLQSDLDTPECESGDMHPVLFTQQAVRYHRRHTAKGPIIVFLIMMQLYAGRNASKE